MSENTITPEVDSAQALVDLLQSKTTVVEGNIARMFWLNGAWEVMTWYDDETDGPFWDDDDNLKESTTEYRGPDLAAAIDTFRKIEGIA